MNALLALSNTLVTRLERNEWLLPTLARFTFAAVLLVYFWGSGLTKLGEGFFGIFSPSAGAYVQIFPKVMESVSYDTDMLSWFHWAVVVGGTIAEFVLPALIVLGLLTRLSALAMVGFVIVQSLTDLYGHGGIEHAATFGAWFDNMSDSAILDQRLLWVSLLFTIVIAGPGRFSLDRIFFAKSKD